MNSIKKIIFIQLIVAAGLMNAQDAAVSLPQTTNTITIDANVLKKLCEKEWFVTKSVDKYKMHERIGTQAWLCSFRFLKTGVLKSCLVNAKWKSTEKLVSIEMNEDSVGENYDALLMKGDWMVNSISDTSLVLAKQFPSNDKRERFIYFSHKKYVEKKFYITANKFVILPGIGKFTVFDKENKLILRGENDTIDISKLKPGPYSLTAGDCMGDFIKK